MSTSYLLELQIMLVTEIGVLCCQGVKEDLRTVTPNPKVRHVDQASQAKRLSAMHDRGTMIVRPSIKGTDGVDTLDGKALQGQQMTSI